MVIKRWGDDLCRRGISSVVVLGRAGPFGCPLWHQVLMDKGFNYETNGSFRSENGAITKKLWPKQFQYARGYSARRFSDLGDSSCYGFVFESFSRLWKEIGSLLKYTRVFGGGKLIISPYSSSSPKFSRVSSTLCSPFHRLKRPEARFSPARLGPSPILGHHYHQVGFRRKPKNLDLDPLEKMKMVMKLPNRNLGCNTQLLAIDDAIEVKMNPRFGFYEGKKMRGKTRKKNGLRMKNEAKSDF
ncbi:hypothetical protein L6452_13381 [Arctium lappa]|uniref:Uncharacterized protein n=1 Tax=Arctium lappa TaxID=4217 RepID=A0ACB9CIE4_ARCLA|nr:hypothetical protein L6452_13381 [Arctium lappa]